MSVDERKVVPLATIPIAKRREQEEMARRIAEYEATHGPVKQYDSTANAGYKPNIRDFRIKGPRPKKGC